MNPGTASTLVQWHALFSGACWLHSLKATRSRAPAIHLKGRVQLLQLGMCQLIQSHAVVLRELHRLACHMVRLTKRHSFAHQVVGQIGGLPSDRQTRRASWQLTAVEGGGSVFARKSSPFSRTDQHNARIVRPHAPASLEPAQQSYCLRSLSAWKARPRQLANKRRLCRRCRIGAPCPPGGPCCMCLVGPS